MWLVGAAIVLGALALRVIALDVRPMHHDESIHAFFAWSFPDYRYDPTYHGPLQITLISAALHLLGPTDAVARLPAVLFGVLLVALPLTIRRRIGDAGALFSAFLFALSPTVIHYSRFAREDILAGALTLALVIAAFAWLERPGRTRLALVFGLLALVIATKETSYITIAIAGIFLASLGIVETIRRRRGLGVGVLSAAMRSTTGRAWLTAGATFLALYGLLFTTFLTNPAGITGIADGIAFWLRQQAEARLAVYVPPYFYLLLLAAYELPVAALGTVGLAVALKRQQLFDLYVAWWFAASLVAFSVASERVPWLLLHLLVPLGILAGMGAQALWARRDWTRGATLVVLGLSVAVFARSAQFLYLDPADPRELLNYVQTTPEVRVAADALRTTVASHSGKPLTVELDTTVGTDWPMSWYLVDSGFDVRPVDMAAAGFVPSADVVMLFDGNRDRHLGSLAAYQGTRLLLRSWWVPGGEAPRWLPDYSAGSPGQWLGWFINRQEWSPVGSDVAWLYVRR